MAVNIRKRPKLLSAEEHVNVTTLEEIFRHFDAVIGTLDGRKVRKVTALDSSATLADVIARINQLIEAIRDGGLMEE